jgi:hypothetical protein
VFPIDLACDGDRLSVVTHLGLKTTGRVDDVAFSLLVHECVCKTFTTKAVFIRKALTTISTAAVDTEPARKLCKRPWIRIETIFLENWSSVESDLYAIVTFDFRSKVDPLPYPCTA